MTAELSLSATLAPLLAAGDVPVRASFGRVAKLGYRAVQLSTTRAGLRPRDLDKAARRDLVATLRRDELTVSGLEAWIPVSHFDDAQHVDRAVNAVVSAIELAADLGRVPVSLHLPTSAEVVATIVQRADHFGIELADFSVPPSANDRVGLGIDPVALLAANSDPAAVVSANATHLVSARLSDLLKSGMRAPIGNKREGRLDVLAYKIALSVAGYRRPVIVDARQWSDPWKGIEQTVEAWSALP